MNSNLRTALVGLLFINCVAMAGGKSNISRGGLGFLYPDHNSASNPGQIALDKGTAFEGQYMMVSDTTSAAAGSVVYSSGKFAIGAGGLRAGTTLTDAGTYSDTVTGGLGFTLAKDKVTMGITGSRDISDNATSDGTVGATLTFNGSKRQGVSIGFGVDTTLNQAVAETRTATAALGYGFKNNASIEIDAKFNSFDDFSDYTMSGYLNLMGKMFYMSAGGSYVALSQTQTLAGRLGVVIGNSFDVSGIVNYPMASGSTPSYGGSLRLAF